MILFGTATPLSKLVSQNFPIYLATFLRTLVAGLTFLPFIFKERGNLKQISGRDWFYLLLISLVGTVGFTVFLLEGTARAPGVVSATLMSFVPLITALGSVLFFGSKFTIKLIWGFVLALAGVLTINLAGLNAGNFQFTPTTILGMVLVLLAILSEATFTLSGKKLSLHLNPVIITGLASLISSLVLLPLAIWQFSGFQPSTVEPVDWSYLAWWAIGTLGLGTWIWYSGLKRAESLNASLFMSVMPLSALIFSYILLGEEFLWIHLVGIVLIPAGIVVAQKG